MTIIELYLFNFNYLSEDYINVFYSMTMCFIRWQKLNIKNLEFLSTQQQSQYQLFQSSVNNQMIAIIEMVFNVRVL